MAMIQPNNLLSNIQGWEEKEKEKLLKKQRHRCFHLFSEDKDEDYNHGDDYDGDVLYDELDLNDSKEWISNVSMCLLL